VGSPVERNCGRRHSLGREHRPRELVARAATGSRRETCHRASKQTPPMLKPRFYLSCALAVAAVLADAALASAEPKLDALFQDHMILQRDRVTPIWGTAAAAGEQVTVTFAGQTKQTNAEANGRWRVNLDAMPAAAEGRMLTAGTQSCKDVLVGDVWLCSGSPTWQ